MNKLNKFKKMLTPVFCCIVIAFVLLCTMQPVSALPGRSHTYVYECPNSYVTTTAGTTGFYFDLLNTPVPGTMTVTTYNSDPGEYYTNKGDLWSTFIFREGYDHHVYYETPTFYVDEIFPFAGESIVDCNWIFALPVTYFSGSLRFDDPYIAFYFYNASGDMFKSVWYEFPDDPVVGEYYNEYFISILEPFPAECKGAAYFHIETGFYDVTVVESTSGFVEKDVALSKFQYFVSLPTGSLAEMILKGELSNFEDQLQADQFGDSVDSLLGSMDSVGAVPNINWNDFAVDDLVSGDAFLNVNTFLATFYDSAVLTKILLLLSGLILVSYILYASKGV